MKFKYSIKNKSKIFKKIKENLNFKGILYFIKNKRKNF